MASNNNKLPAEILSYIFLLARSEILPFSNRKVPWTVGCVCRFWRNVALSEPRLWASIRVDFRPWSEAEAENIHQMLSNSLERSSGQPLYIHMHQSYGSTGPSALPIYLALTRSIESWYSLRLSGCVSQTAFGAVDHVPSKGTILSSLRELHLDFQNYRGDTSFKDHPIVRILFQGRRHTPGLHTISFSAIEHIYLSNECLQSLGWRQLEELRVDNRTLHAEPRVLALLKECANLEVLSIPLRLSLARLPPSYNKLRMAYLRSLKLRMRACTIADVSICSYLVLPALEWLDVEFVRIEAGHMFDSIIGMVERSQCSLKHLSVESLALMDASVERLIRLAPKCTSLSLQGCVFSHLFNVITCDDTFLPRLQHLGIRSSATNIRAPLGVVLSAIRARSSTLQSVELELCTESEDFESRDELAMFGRLGITMYVQEYSPEPHRYELDLFRTLGNLAHSWSKYGSLAAVDSTGQRIMTENAKTLHEALELVDHLKMNHHVSLEEVQSAMLGTVREIRGFNTTSNSLFVEYLEAEYHFKERMEGMTYLETFNDVSSPVIIYGDLSPLALLSRLSKIPPS
uniref:Uncharacterized protein n=1 Tax=Moniliophthora roreri TaxID=221103 RepID=A0A0W0F449_MONRR